MYDRDVRYNQLLHHCIDVERCADTQRVRAQGGGGTSQSARMRALAASIGLRQLTNTVEFARHISPSFRATAEATGTGEKWEGVGIPNDSTTYSLFR